MLRNSKPFIERSRRDEGWTAKQATRPPEPMQATAIAGGGEGLGLAPVPDLERTPRSQQGTSQEDSEETEGKGARVAVGGLPYPVPQSPVDPSVAERVYVNQPDSVSTGDGATCDRHATPQPDAVGTTSGCNGAVGSVVVATTKAATSETKASDGEGDHTPKASGGVHPEAENSAGNSEEKQTDSLPNVHDARAGSVIQSGGNRPFQSNGRKAGRSSEPPVRASSNRVQ